jgi:glucose-6-phosphate dehydrogenase assembly protein OpcA
VQPKVKVHDPQAIEQTLNELRQASLTSAGPALPPVRATAANLIAYAATPADADEMAALAASLAEQHPSRAIIVGPDPRQPPGEWDIQVSAHCRPAVPALVVCFEAVQILASAEAVERIPAVALSLLLRDLPVYLWWPGDPAIGTPLFERLMANADRLVVDSATAADPEALLRGLVALGHAEHCQCAVRDLNWDRLTPWRELTAQFFDPPDCRPCLERLEEVRLEFCGAGGEPLPAQGYLLVAWLATRLGWTPAPVPCHEVPAGMRVHMLRGRQPVSVELVPDAMPAPCDARPGELRRLVLHSGHPQGRATFSVSRSEDGGYARVTTRLPRRPDRERTVSFPSPGMAALLGEELRRSGYDTVYQEALRLAAFLAAQRACPSRDLPRL